MKEINLTNNKVCLVDDEDFSNLNLFCWGTVNNGSHIYAARGTRKKGHPYTKILMHRVIMDAPVDKMVDHINGNTLDNRKENLRLTDRTGNLRNSKRRSDCVSKYKGVSVKTYKNKIFYAARIQIDTKTRLFLGNFDSEIDAAKAYNEAAVKYFGEFAKVNKI